MRQKKYGSLHFFFFLTKWRTWSSWLFGFQITLDEQKFSLSEDTENKLTDTKGERWGVGRWEELGDWD